jgi:signal transduction histidine kinase
VTEYEQTLEATVLRESIRARVSVAWLSLIGTYSSVFLFLPFLVSQGVASLRITVWALPILLLVGGRSMYSRRVYKKLEALTFPDMLSIDKRLRLSSIVNQFVVGTGIWIMYAPTADPYVLSLFMTLVVVIFSIGVIANLFSDYKTFVLSIPLLIGQPALFWITQGDIGLAIGFGMLLAMTLSIVLVKRGTAIFRESVLMRFEKDQLLSQVKDEQEKTREALLEVQAANDSKTFFMAAASHDIKQPLFALSMLTDTLLLSELPGSAKSILEQQRQNIKVMGEHFDALMDLSKFQAGNFSARYRPTELEEVRRALDIEFAPLCQEKNLAWHVSMDEIRVWTDPDLLLRLLRNLLANAVRYTDTGSVSCTAKHQGDKLEFVVADTGPGIAAEDQATVFKEFVRLENTEAERTGAGLGLAIVDNINRELALGLKIVSAPGQGTRFEFAVPVSVDS